MDWRRPEARDEFGDVCDIVIERDLCGVGRPIRFAAAVQVAIDHSVAVRESGEMRVKNQVGPRRPEP
jgi:hypothetical protein